jgi:hypothetical protein
MVATAVAGGDWGHQATCISKRVISSVMHKGPNTFPPHKSVF